MANPKGPSDGRAADRSRGPAASTCARPRSFAITDLLGLEVETSEPSGPDTGSRCSGPASACFADCGFGGSPMARGALPLELGVLRGFGVQPPPVTRAPCFLVADVPLLYPPAQGSGAQARGHPLRALIGQKRSESDSTSGNHARPSGSCPSSPGFGRYRATHRRPIELPSPSQVFWKSGPKSRARADETESASRIL